MWMLWFAGVPVERVGQGPQRVVADLDRLIRNQDGGQGKERQ
jgi:hypothetical protein